MRDIVCVCACVFVCVCVQQAMGALQVWIIDVADLVFADPPEVTSSSLSLSLSPSLSPCLVFADPPEVTTRAFMRSRGSVAALIHSHPPPPPPLRQVLGQGTFGTVLKAEYRGSTGEFKRARSHRRHSLPPARHHHNLRW